MLAEWVGGDLLAGKREVGGAELAGTVADERSYAVGALGFVDADLDAGVLLAERPIRFAIGSTASVASAAISSRSGLQLDDPGDRVPRFVDRSQDLTGGTDERRARRG